jgi:hypothetical protein
MFRVMFSGKLFSCITGTEINLYNTDGSVGAAAEPV